MWYSTDQALQTGSGICTCPWYRLAGRLGYPQHLHHRQANATGDEVQSTKSNSCKRIGTFHFQTSQPRQCSAKAVGIGSAMRH